jgi:uncharacterized phage-associated protein
MSYPAIDCANWFIAKAAEFGDLTTHLKVQKMLYYGQAWALALLEQPLFDEEIEAWAHGPVVPEVFHHFKPFGWKALDIPAIEQLPQFDADTLGVLEQVFETYGDMSAKTLEAMTHSDQPWITARAGLPMEMRCETVMPKAAIRDYFVRKYEIDQATNQQKAA